jgi:hypothetical protein
MKNRSAQIPGAATMPLAVAAAASVLRSPTPVMSAGAYGETDGTNDGEPGNDVLCSKDSTKDVATDCSFSPVRVEKMTAAVASSESSEAKVPAKATLETTVSEEKSFELQTSKAEVGIKSLDRNGADAIIVPANANVANMTTVEDDEVAAASLAGKKANETFLEPVSEGLERIWYLISTGSRVGHTPPTALNQDTSLFSTGLVCVNQSMNDPQQHTLARQLKELFEADPILP